MCCLVLRSNFALLLTIQFASLISSLINIICLLLTTFDWTKVRGIAPRSHTGRSRTCLVYLMDTCFIHDRYKPGHYSEVLVFAEPLADLKCKKDVQVSPSNKLRSMGNSATCQTEGKLFLREYLFSWLFKSLECGFSYLPLYE